MPCPVTLFDPVHTSTIITIYRLKERVTNLYEYKCLCKADGLIYLSQQ